MLTGCRGIPSDWDVLGIRLNYSGTSPQVTGKIKLTVTPAGLDEGRQRRPINNAIAEGTPGEIDDRSQPPFAPGYKAL